MVIVAAARRTGRVADGRRGRRPRVCRPTALLQEWEVQGGFVTHNLLESTLQLALFRALIFERRLQLGHLRLQRLQEVARVIRQVCASDMHGQS